jgi:hypothetical protein
MKVFFQKRVTRTELDIYVFILNVLHYWIGNNINQVNHFQYVTCEMIEKIIEWDMISKCFFGADFAKCKKIIANC